MGIFFWLVFGSFLGVCFECVYSLYKKDRIYSLSGTVGNLLRGVLVVLLSGRMMTLSFALIFTLWLEGNSFYTYRAEDIGWISFFLCLLSIDLCWYIFHRVHHAFRFPWALHSVHHGDNSFNLSSAFRISWIEQLYLFFFFLPVLLIGFHPTLFFLSILYLNIHQFLCHSQYIRLPKVTDFFFVTPGNHKIHHDQSEKNQHSNFGAVFSIWDRLFGTYVAEIEHFTPGIKGYRQDNFIKMEMDPLRAYFRGMLARKNL
jgi:sterol desaturase/sphingolipid hydroxylase (fatty acid hydroxylase superfamily)